MWNRSNLNNWFIVIFTIHFILTITYGKKAPIIKRPEHLEPTVTLVKDLNTIGIADKIQKAVNASDYQLVGLILASMNSYQRMIVLYHHDRRYPYLNLKDKIEDNLHGPLKYLLQRLLNSIEDIYVELLHRAANKNPFDVDGFVEAFLEVQEADLNTVNYLYKYKYNTWLEYDLNNIRNPFVRSFLQCSLEARLHTSGFYDFDPIRATTEYEKLNSEKRRNQSALITGIAQMLCINSPRNVKHLAELYQKGNGDNLLGIINSLTSNETHYALSSFLKYANDRSRWFGELISAKLRSSDQLKQYQKDYAIITHSEVDLETLKKSYIAVKGNSLLSELMRPAKSAYGNILIKLSKPKDKMIIEKSKASNIVANGVFAILVTIFIQFIIQFV